MRFFPKYKHKLLSNFIWLLDRNKSGNTWLIKTKLLYFFFTHNMQCNIHTYTYMYRYNIYIYTYSSSGLIIALKLLHRNNQNCLFSFCFYIYHTIFQTDICTQCEPKFYRFHFHKPNFIDFGSASTNDTADEVIRYSNFVLLCIGPSRRLLLGSWKARRYAHTRYACKRNTFIALYRITCHSCSVQDKVQFEFWLLHCKRVEFAKRGF